MILSFILTTAEKALNRFLQLDAEVNTRLAPIAGRVVSVHFQAVDSVVYFLMGENNIRLLREYKGVPDVTLSGAPFAFLRLAQTPASSAALFNNNIKISGDMEVAQRFKKIFAELDVDWEEQLSKLTGDVIAQQIGKFVRSLTLWARSSAESLSLDLKEYVQDERRWLPLRTETEDFMQTVDEVRDSVERLDARVQRLRRQIET